MEYCLKMMILRLYFSFQKLRLAVCGRVCRLCSIWCHLCQWQIGANGKANQLPWQNYLLLQTPEETTKEKSQNFETTQVKKKSERNRLSSINWDILKPQFQLI